MRIVGGKYKSRVLNEFDRIGVRPTGDKARESLFNIISLLIPDSYFLDAFSGTGAIGIEALSRGAKKVTFLDNSRKSVDLIKSNLLKLGIKGGADVVFTDALPFMERSEAVYDIIFIDPPYSSDLSEKAVKASYNAVKDGGLVIVEDEKPFSVNIDGFNKSDERRYGRAYLTFFIKENK